VNVVLLALSLVALAIGPLAATLFKETRGSRGLIEGLALVAVCGLVVLHVVPHAVAVAGWSALAVAAAGFAAPFLAEHWRRGRDAGSVALVPVVIASFGAHAFIDGGRPRAGCRAVPRSIRGARGGCFIAFRTAWPSGRW
jgi:hypothetical protein